MNCGSWKDKEADSEEAGFSEILKEIREWSNGECFTVKRLR